MHTHTFAIESDEDMSAQKTLLVAKSWSGDFKEIVLRRREEQRRKEKRREENNTGTHIKQWAERIQNEFRLNLTLTEIIQLKLKLSVSYLFFFSRKKIILISQIHFIWCVLCLSITFKFPFFSQPLPLISFILSFFFLLCWLAGYGTDVMPSCVFDGITMT